MSALLCASLLALKYKYDHWILDQLCIDFMHSLIPIIQTAVWVFVRGIVFYLLKYKYNYIFGWLWPYELKYVIKIIYVVCNYKDLYFKTV